MCSSDFGLYDFLFEREDICKDDEDSLRNALFASNDQLMQTPVLRQESPDTDYKVVNDFEADDLWRSFLENDLTVKEDIAFDNPLSSSSPHGSSKGEDDFDSLRDLVGLPLDAVMDKFDPDRLDEMVDSSASDSGVSSDTGIDHHFSADFGSPELHNHQASPTDRGFASPDTLDAESDTSSISEQGSLSPAGYSPSGANGRIPSYQFELISSPTESKETKPTSFLESQSSSAPFIKIASGEAESSPKVKLELTSSSPTPQPAKRPPRLTKVRLDLARGLHATTPGSAGSASPATPAQGGGGTPSPAASGGLNALGKTIVVTHPAKGTASLLRTGGGGSGGTGTLLKTASVNGRSILLPVNVKDINQVKTIKIISAGNNTANLTNKNSVRTLFSAIQTSGSQSSTTGLRTLFTTSKTADGRSLLKVTPTAMVTPNTVTPSHVSPAITIKEECITSDDEGHQNGQELVLTEEEKRLLKKEAIILPAHYPLTKQEERDLKRIRRKIRNKISAQDSRKRKKEYVDGLEDRVKSCTEENHQLQKRIRSLESQNESLMTQLKKFHSILGTGVNGRNQGHASTALMMLILSAALFVVPSLRPQQGGGENEVSRSSELPSSGRSRTLLEAKVPLGMNPLDNADEDQSTDSDSSNPLSDHDYAPLAKKRKLMSPPYYPSLIEDFPPRLDKTLPDGSGEPPDGIGGLKDISALMGAFLDRLSNNWTDPGGQDALVRTLEEGEKKRNRSLVVNLTPKGRLRDDIELE